MRKILFLLLAGLQTGALSAQSGHNANHEPFIVRSLTSESIQEAYMETTGGNIAVTGVSAAGDARLEIYVRGNREHHGDPELTKEEIQEKLDKLYDLSVSVSNNKLSVTARPKERNMGWRKGLNISFELFVPSSVSTELRTSGGNIALKNLSGRSQDFSTSGGNLDIDGLSGKINGKTSGGNILLVNSKEDIDLSTSGGNIEASNCHGHIRLSTSGGNLKLHLLEGDIRASTSGGNVTGEEITGELSAGTSGGNVWLKDMSCSLATSTSGGSIAVSLLELGKYLTISNSGGNIDLSLPAKKGVDLKVYADKVKISGLNDFTGETDEKHIRGSMDGGGVPVKVDGGGGTVNLSFR